MVTFIVTMLIAVAGVVLTAVRGVGLALIGWAMYFFGLWSMVYRTRPTEFDGLPFWSLAGWIVFFAVCTFVCAVFVRLIAWRSLQQIIPARKQTGAPSPAAPFRPAWGRTRFVPASRTAASAARRSRYTAHTK